jgi:Na+-translocating ferredoxin:NAD+ oxidoreductase subunit B
MKRTAVALVDEARCIGCARCIDACPVDAIAGARGYMHAVIADYCTGCELCLPPCPVDCIDMVAAPGPWTTVHAKGAKRRADVRKRRIEDERPQSSARDRKAVIAAALKRKLKI